MKAWSLPLLPFAGIYSAAMALRNWTYAQGWKRSHHIGIPVVSIGNITVGGTGKTPMAEFLLTYLLGMGLRPAYLSRGYGRKTKGYIKVMPSTGDASSYGDEAFQVASKFPNVPVAVCEDRVVGAKELLQTHPIDILVLDDAFQHRRIHRDLDWVMMDATRPPSADWPFPAGRLREGLRGLRRADALILTKFSQPQAQATALADLKKRFPAQIAAAFDLQPLSVQPFFPDQEPQSHKLEGLAGKSVILFSGIGNPNHFVDTVIAAGAITVQTRTFSDHHRYTEADFDKILAAFESQKEIKGKLPPALILTTEKDYFRLKGMPWIQRFAHLPLAFLTVGMVPLAGWEQLALQLNKIIKEARHE